MKRIAILFHRREQKPANYLVHHLRRFWEEDGHEVIYLFGTRQFIPADILLVHVDLSVVPEDYLSFAERYPIVINGHVRDIRKTTISDNLVGPNSSWGGPVIVKSNLNYFGTPERELRRSWAERRWPFLERLRKGLERRLYPGGLHYPDHFEYEVFEQIDDVPADRFMSKNIVVEKFLPEMENGLYHLRMALILGDRVRCVRITANHAVIKASLSVHSEDIEPHPAVADWRQRFHLDYGKVDYVVRDGEAILLDVNKTIGTTGSYRDSETLNATRRYLAQGLYTYIT